MIGSGEPGTMIIARDGDGLDRWASGQRLENAFALLAECFARFSQGEMPSHSGIRHEELVDDCD